MAKPVYGSAAPDTLVGDAGANLDDSLYGFGGNDRLAGGLGSNFLSGGPGTDGANYNLISPFGGPVQQVTADLTSGIGIAAYAGGVYGLDVFHEVENLVGSRGDDVLSGNEARNVIFGGNGADELIGRGGDDVLNGGNGNDRLEGGSGADRLDGGNNSDTLDGGAGVDRLDGGQGSDTYLWRTGDGVDSIVDSGTAGHDVIKGDGLGLTGLPSLFSAANGIEDIAQSGGIAAARTGAVNWSFLNVDTHAAAISGGAGNDTIRGTDVYGETIAGGLGRDTLYGGGGADRLIGEAGSDVLSGESGDDVLIGGEGADTLVGGDGKDVLNGGAGTDVYIGGAGNDVFRVAQTETSVRLSFADAILDFEGAGFVLGYGGAKDKVLFDVADPLTGHVSPISVSADGSLGVFAFGSAGSGPDGVVSIAFSSGPGGLSAAATFVVDPNAYGFV